MRSEIFSGSAPVESQERFALQNPQSMRVGLGADVLATKGAMVSYRGQVQFHHEKSGGIGKLAKKVATSEDVSLMRVSGQGEVWFAEEAGFIHLLELENESLSTNFRNLLAFDSSLAWDINRVKGAGIATGGLFNTTLNGSGTVAVTVVGHAMVLDCSQQPVYVDPQSAVCWSGTLVPSIQNSMNMKSMMRGGSGEAIQYAFHGPGFVIVQAYEWKPPPANRKSGGILGTVGDLIP
ncbi:MAG: AIM24 family protein [Nocardioides sp.]|nr:AIM24 family protein [Nocardioides sp.]